MPKRRGDYNRISFETAVSANKRTLAEVDDMRRKGTIKDDDYLFTLEDLLKICESPAVGFYNLAAIQSNPLGKWSMRDFRPTLVREIIKEAFSSKSLGNVRKVKKRTSI